MNVKRALYSLTHPVQSILVSEGKAAFCDSCDKIVSGFIGYEQNGVRMRTCLDCTEKENEDKTFKFENDDKEKQFVEYNSYDNEGKKLGGVKISYFTEEQIEKIEKIKESINKK